MVSHSQPYEENEADNQSESAEVGLRPRLILVSLALLTTLGCRVKHVQPSDVPEVLFRHDFMHLVIGLVHLVWTAIL